MALEPQVKHPFRLVLEPGDIGDDLRGQATLRRGSGNITIRPAPLIVTEGSQMLILGLAGTDRSGDSGILSLGHDHGLSDVVISVVVLRPDGGTVWNMSRADTIAVRDGGEALHMDTEEPRERGGLYFADLGKAFGHMCNRAVMLAQLFTDRRRQCGRDIAVLGQGDGESLRRCAVRCGVGHPLLVALSLSAILDSAKRVTASGPAEAARNSIASIARSS